MSIVFPPDKTPKYYKRILSSIDGSLHEDAIQSAWVAYLDGGNGVNGLIRFIDKNRRYFRKRKFLSNPDQFCDDGIQINQSAVKSNRIRSMIRPDDAR